MIRRALSVASAIVVILALYFWDDIQNVRALLAYSKIFESDSIDENFRSMRDRFPSIAIRRSGDAADFELALRSDVFPEDYRLNGVSHPFRPMWDEFHVTGLVILQDGKLVFDQYYRGNSADSFHIEMSVTKSLTALVFGAVYERGDISDLDAKVTDYIPELKGTGYEGVTIQNVLDMTSGIRYTEDYDDLESDIVKTVVASLRGSLDEYITTMVNERTPGEFNQYASVETQVLALIMRRATKQSYAELFDELLWSKIGAEADAHLLVDSTGEPLAYGGANLRLRDLARIGQTLLNGGVSMSGERVVSEDWIRRSTTPDTPQSQPGYDNAWSDYPLGYKNHWWIPTDRSGGEFTAIGIYGQFLYVNPDAQIVIAMNSAYPGYNDEDNLELDMVAGLQAIAAHLVGAEEGGD